jgi:hypothetical protein
MSGWPIALAPKLVKAAVEGRLPRGIGVERLRDLPIEWSQQFEMLVSARPNIPNYGSAKIGNTASTAFGRPGMTEAPKVGIAGENA